MNRPTGTGGRGTATQPPRSGAAERAANSARTRAFIDGLVSEMRRITWPTRREWVSATVLTVGLVASIGLYTYVLDQVFGFGFGLVHK
jgi:preprotein translocase SecE subunit